MGAGAGHMAERYHYLGRFLETAGYVSGPPGRANNHGHDHVADPSKMLDRLTGGKAPIGLVANLADEQLDSVPPARSGRFSHGRRTLEQVIDDVIAHQAALLVTLKQAVG